MIMTKDFLTEAFISMKDRLRAEDSLQEAFCRLWGRKYKASSLKEAVGLLSRTVRNIEIDEYRKTRGRRTTGLETVRIEDDGDQTFEREALFRRVEASLDEDFLVVDCSDDNGSMLGPDEIFGRIRAIVDKRLH